MPKMPVNSELVKGLSSFFRRRNEVQYTLADAMALHLAIPGLRGLWVGGTKYDTTGTTLLDASGNGVSLSSGGVPSKPTVTADASSPAPYIEFSGAPASSSSNETRVIGTEGGHSPNGLTLGAWLYFDVTGQWHGIMGRGQHSDNTRSYRLYRHITGNYPVAQVSSAGTAWDSSVDGAAIDNATWAFVAVRYTPSTELKIWTNETTATNTTSIPGSLRSTTNPFDLGADGYDLAMDGRVAFAWLSACAVPDPLIWMLYQNTRSIFGV